MNVFQELKEIGVDTEDGLRRLGGNSSLYERMLVKLKDMIKNSPIPLDFDDNDYEDIIDIAHTIKGASGNLAIKPIYESYTEIVGLLRSQQPEEAKKKLEEVLPLQNAMIECIEKYS